MKLTINNTSHEITPISKLTFSEFNKLMVKNEVFELKEYISCFIDMPIEELMSAEIKTLSMPALHASIYDIDIEKTVKDCPSTIPFDDDIYIVDHINLSTFGQNYMFDLYYEKFKSKKINEYELCMYALSCALSKDYLTTEIQRNYDILSKRDWRKVLPAAFFLAKKLLRKKGNSIMLWVIYTTGLKRMKRLSMYRMSNYKRSVKNLLPRFWLN